MRKIQARRLCYFGRRLRATAGAHQARATLRLEIYAPPKQPGTPNPELGTAPRAHVRELHPGLKPISANLLQQREGATTHLSRRDQSEGSLARSAGKKKKDPSSPVGTVDQVSCKYVILLSSVLAKQKTSNNNVSPILEDQPSLRDGYVFSAFLRELRRSKIFRWLRKRGSARNWECSFPG